MKRGLSGYICVRNAERLDYCWREAVNSILPVCDEVVICDSDSTDGTLDLARTWATMEPKIRVVRWAYPDPPPFGDRDWTNRWYNDTRRLLEYDMQINFDADEVLDPCSFPEIRAAVEKRECKLARYVHFNHKPYLTSPWGDGLKAIMAPTSFYMHTHGPGPEGEPKIRDHATVGDNIVLYHYSTLRKRDCYADKMRVIIPSLEGWIPTFEHLEPLPGDAPNFTGRHPDVIREWLIARGHEL